MYSGTPNQSLTSRGIQLSFLTTADLLSYEKTFMDQGAVANGYKLPAAKIYDLFRMSNVDNESLVKIWDLSSVANAPFLTLPEFVLAMFLINLKLNGKPLPTSLPSNIRQEIQMAMTALSSQPMQVNNQFNPQQQQQQQLMPQQQLPMMTGMPPPQMPLMTGAPVPAVQTGYTTGYQVPMQTGFNTPTPPPLPQPQVQNFDFAMKMMPNQSRASNLLGTAAGANRNSWKISPEDKQRYREVFYAWETTGTGYMSGEVAKEVFTQSQLPPNDLQKIWNLADTDNKGSLDIDEFAIAMHLIYRRSNGLDVPSELPAELAPPTNVLKKFVLGHRPPASAPRFNSSSETSSYQKNQPSRHYANDSDSDSDVDMETVEALRRQISEAKRHLSQVQSESPRDHGANTNSIGIKYSLEELKEKIKRANQDLTAAYRNNMSSSKYIENTSTLFELLETQKSLQDEIQYLCNRDIPVLTRQLRGSAAELRDAKLRNSKKNDSALDFMSFIKPTGPGGTVTESDRVRAKAQAMMAARRAGSGSGSNSNSEAKRAEEEKEEADRKADYADRDIERSRAALSEMRGDLRYLEEMGIANHFGDKKRFDNAHELSYELRRFIEQLNHDAAMNFSYSSQNYGSRNTSSVASSTTAATISGSGPSTAYKNTASTSSNTPVSSQSQASVPSRPRTAEEIKLEAERRVQERLAALQAKRNPGGVPKAPKPSSVSKPDEAAAQKVRDEERQAQEKLRMSVAQRQEERERKNNTFEISREIEPVYNTVEQPDVQNEEDEAERLRREQEEDEQRRIDEEKELEERRKLVLAKEEAARQARFDALKREEEEAELRAQKYTQQKPESPVIEQKEAHVAPITESTSTGTGVPPPPPPPPPAPTAVPIAPVTPAESTSTPSTGSKNPFAKLQQEKSTTEATRSFSSPSQPEKPNESANKRTSYNPFAAFSAFSATKGGSKDDSDSEDDGWDAHNDSEDEDEFPAAGSAKNLAGMIFNVMNKKQGGSSLETVPESSPTLSSNNAPEPTSSDNIPPPPPPPAPAAPVAPQQSFTPPASSGDSRSALLGQIQMGTSLRKVTTNDRSASSVAGKVLGSSSTPTQPTQITPAVSNKVSQEPQQEPISTPTPSDGFFSELQARTNGNTSVEPQVQSSEESGIGKEYIALWDYPGSGPDDLPFSQDDIVLVNDDKDSEDWWFGTLKKSNQSGYFPRSYVEPKPSDVPALNLKARALYDFDAPEGQDCLSITTGSMLTIIKKDNNDWWRAQSEDGSKTGLVPANYVELI